MKLLLSHLAERYIAGEERSDALEKVRELNSLGIAATIDHLGESLTGESEAEEAAAEYLALIDEISAEGLDASVSLKLTHMGLDISYGLATENTLAVVRRAGEAASFVRVDMEGSAYTTLTLDAVAAIHERHDNIGVAIQSYLKRSAEDLRRMISDGVSVRLVKGAYKEAPRIAFADKADVDGNFSRLMRRLLLEGNRPAIATHDVALIEETKKFAADRDIGPERFEFQMLMGIKRELQKELARDGYRVKVYVPYGRDWLPYILRRLTERKENLFFLLKHILD